MISEQQQLLESIRKSLQKSIDYWTKERDIPYVDNDFWFEMDGRIQGIQESLEVINMVEYVINPPLEPNTIEENLESLPGNDRPAWIDSGKDRPAWIDGNDRPAWIDGNDCK